MSTATPSPSSVPQGRLWRAGVVAAVVAVVGNAALFFVVRAAGGWPPDVLNPMGQPIGLSAVAFLSVVPPLVATLLLVLLLRFAPRPLAIFWGVAALVFVLFSSGPFSLGAPPAMLWTLQLMHLVVAVPTVWLLTRAARG